MDTMKKLTLVLPLLVMISISTHANSNNESFKIATVKTMYDDAIRAALYKDSRADDLDTVFAYSDRELQNAIALIQSDALSRYEGYEYEISNCSDMRYIPKLTVGNAYSNEDVSEVSYQLLNNGKVRASLMVQGNENINSADFVDYKDFELTCQNAICKITDVYDSFGNSAKFSANQACR